MRRIIVITMKVVMSIVTNKDGPKKSGWLIMRVAINRDMLSNQPNINFDTTLAKATLFTSNGLQFAVTEEEAFSAVKILIQSSLAAWIIDRPWKNS